MGKLRVAAVAVAGVVAILPAAASAHTKTVYAGGPPNWAQKLQHRYGAGVNNFLINRVTINAGDTVVWSGASLNGGFHTVDIPKLHGPDLPLIVPTGSLVGGVNDAAGNPFWFNGKVPQVSFNSALAAPSGGNVYNGTSRIDSGLPTGPPHDFAVKFTAPGVYRYFCDVHPGMSGYVVVRAKGKPIPSAKRDANVLRAEEQHFVAEARQVDKTKTHGANVSLGASGPGGLEVFAMFPATLKVKKGTTVRFSMSKQSREVHTASFGPKAYLKGLADSFASPFPSAAAVYPSDPPSTISLTSASHGNGFANTGILDRDSGTAPIPSSGTITFTQAGTYEFVCLIHPFMHGTIVVK